MGKQRISRFQKPKQPPPMAIEQGRYYLPILDLLYQYRYLTHEQILALLHGQGVPIGNSYLRDVLRLLWHGNYVERRFRQTRKGSLPVIYTLSRKGAERVSVQRGMFCDDLIYPKPPEKSRPHKGYPTSESDYLDHALLVSHILCCFSLACHPHPTWKLLGFCHDLEKLRHLHTSIIPERFSVHSEIPICPDGVLMLQCVAGENMGKRILFMLEADRSTEERGRIKRKMMGYLELYEQAKHYDFLRKIGQQMMEIPEEDLLDHKLRVYRVLFVTLSARRTQGLLETAYSLDGQGSGMFLFTQQDCLSLKNPHRVLSDNIWHIGLRDALEPMALIQG